MPKTHSAFPASRIKKLVQAVIPRGQNYKIRVSDSGFDESKVVRVITPAWKRLQRHQRILKFLEAEDQFITKEDRRHILRYSVLTPQEFERHVKESPIKITSRALR
ncbi:MAG: hypothetical protein RL015_2398 [Verrucomicrobiota bacterium]|jgi:hypothetical protein